VKAQATFGFFAATIENGVTVPIVPAGVVLDLTGAQYVAMRDRWAELGEEDRAKVRRFESFATGCGPIR
jgi:hypothetical protein